jgi:hypothetical protein
MALKVIQARVGFNPQSWLMGTWLRRGRLGAEPLVSAQHYYFCSNNALFELGFIENCRAINYAQLPNKATKHGNHRVFANNPPRFVEPSAPTTATEDELNRLHCWDT